MKKTLLKTVSLGVFLGALSLTPVKSYGAMASNESRFQAPYRSQIIEEFGPLDAADWNQLWNLFETNGGNMRKTLQAFRIQRHTRREAFHEERYDAAAAQIANLEGLLDGAHQEIRRLTATNHRLAALTDELLTRGERLVRALQQERDGHGRTAQRLHETEAQLQNLRLNFIRVITDTERTIETLQGNLADVRGENAQFRAVIGQLKEQLQNSQRRYSEIETASIRIAQAMRIEVSGMTAGQAASAIIQKFQEELTRSERFQALCDETRQQTNKLLSQQGTTITELRKAFAENVVLREQLRTKVTELEGQKAQIGELQRERRGLKKETDALRHALSETEDRNRELQKDLQVLTKVIDMIAQRLELPSSGGNIVDSIFAKIGEYKNKFLADAQSLRLYQEHLSMLQAKLAAALQESEMWKESDKVRKVRIDQLFDVLDANKEEISRSHKDFDELVKRTEENALQAQEQMAALRDEYQRELEKLRRQLDKSQEQATSSHEDGEQLIGELAEKREQVKSLQARIAILEEEMSSSSAEAVTTIAHLSQKALADLEYMRILVREKIDYTKRFLPAGDVPAKKLSSDLEGISAILDAAISNLQISIQKSPLGIPELSRTQASRRVWGSPRSPRTPLRNPEEGGAAAAADSNVPGSTLTGSSSTSRLSLFEPTSRVPGKGGQSPKTGLYTAGGLKERPPSPSNRRPTLFEDEE
jgi:hypothetical protein